MHKRMACLIILLVIFMASSCSPVPSIKTPGATSVADGATLLQERCSRCHPLARVERSSHTADEWKAIVDNMIRRGARLTPEEESVLVDYLAAKFGN